MPGLNMLCRTVTTFSKSKAFDEAAFRLFLQRFIDNHIDIYLAAGGAGEGHALSRDELKRVYRAGVEACKGKIGVNANLPEQNTAEATIEHAQIAIDAGIEIVQIYGPAAWHGYKPTDQEFAAYFDTVLKAVKHPVAIASNPVIGYMQKPAWIAAVCNRYPQVVEVNLSGVRDGYFIELKEMLKRDVAINVPLPGSLHTLTLGARGLIAADANIIPKTFKRYGDLYQSGNFAALALTYAELERFNRYVSKWHGSTPRWIKMAMQVLKLPGWEGGVRGPYQIPPADEMEKFADGLLRLHLAEIDELARAAGLKLPT